MKKHTYQEYLKLHLLLESNKYNKYINYIFTPIYKSRETQFSNNISFLFHR